VEVGLGGSEGREERCEEEEEEEMACWSRARDLDLLGAGRGIR
jgi:hypothetical protein